MQVVGSFILRTMALSHPCVDLAVVMPAACFHDRDFKNYVCVGAPSLKAGSVMGVVRVLCLGRLAGS